MGSDEVKNAYYNTDNTEHYTDLFGNNGGLAPNKVVIIGQKGSGSVVPVWKSGNEKVKVEKKGSVKVKKRKVYPLYAM